jgi:hypothetical protein
VDFQNNPNPALRQRQSPRLGYNATHLLTNCHGEPMTALLETLLLAAHLMCVNVASGGPLVAAWLDWRGTRGDTAAAKGAVYLARASLLGLILGGLLGFLIGWIKWDADYRSLWLGPLSYKLHWAGIELAFSILLTVGWWLWLPGKAGGSFRSMATRGLIAVLAATNLLYHFPILFAVADRLASTGQTQGEQITGAAFRRLMVEGEAPALAVHVTLASVAMAGIMLLGLSLRWLKRGETAPAKRIAVWGGRIALLPTVLQAPVGLWTLATMPADAQSSLMGESAVGTLLLAGSLLAAFWLVNDLVKVAMSEVSRSLLIRVMAAMLVTVLLMTAMQRQTRAAVGQASLPSAVGHALRGVPNVRVNHPPRNATEAVPYKNDP